MLFGVHETRRESVRLLDYLAAACIAGAGYLHYCVYLKGYRAIPTIGTGFLFQFLGSGIVAVALVIPFELRVQARRIAVSTRIGARLAGIALSAGTLVAFVLSRLPGGLFNFQERGLQPAPQSLLTILTAEVFRTALGPLRTSASIGEVRAYLLATARTVLAAHWKRRFQLEITRIDVERDIALLDEPPAESDAPQRVNRILAALPENYS